MELTIKLKGKREKLVLLRALARYAEEYGMLESGEMADMLFNRITQQGE